MKGNIVQLVISQLQADAAREKFFELHRQTHDWMQSHPDCLQYEVYEGENGAVADRMLWRSHGAALQANREFAELPLAGEMKTIIGRYTAFFGSVVEFEGSGRSNK